MFSITDIFVFVLLGILYGCGMGGGGLLVVYLTLVRGITQGDAQSLNLFFYIIASTSSAFLLLKKRKVNPSLIVLCSLFALPGAFLGSLLRKAISITLLRKIFGVMLAATGLFVFFQRKKQNSRE